MRSASAHRKPARHSRNRVGAAARLTEACPYLLTQIQQNRNTYRVIFSKRRATYYTIRAANLHGTKKISRKTVTFKRRNAIPATLLQRAATRFVLLMANDFFEPDIEIRISTTFNSQ